MPIYLPASTRRRFLQSATASILVSSNPNLASHAADDPANSKATDGDVVYLLNDTHVGEKHPADSPVPTHLRQAVTELIQRDTKPVCVIINGDLALKDGQLGDYIHFAKLIAPLDEAGIDVHLTLGNHDHREAFFEALNSQRPEQSPVESRHVSIVETRHANFFLLDSLKETMVSQGTLGPEQLRWLADALDKRSSKPALIVAHHNPRLGGDPLHFPGGLIDSQPLWDVIGPRKWVKAYVHGHIHDRGYAEHQGIHILNLPATSYVADPSKSTTGWTIGKFTADGITLTTHTTNPDHLWNGQSEILKWRSS